MSFSINGDISVETSPIKWEKPQFFSFLGLYCSKLRGRTGGCPYFDSQDTNNGAMLWCAPLFSAFCSKKCAPVNRKSPGRILDMGRWLVGARSCEEKCGTPMRNGAKPAFLQSYVSTGCSVFRDVAAGIARRHGRSRIRFLGWRNRGLRCLSPCIPLPRRVVGGRPQFGRFRPC